MEKSKEVQKEEPFYYCKRCLSLDIREVDGVSFCNNCGSLNIVEGDDMDDWVDMYNAAYIDDDNFKRYLYSDRKTFRLKKRKSYGKQ